MFPKARPCKKGLDFLLNLCYNKDNPRERFDTMKKIIICEKNPTAACYYKVLRFLLEHATRKEIEGYLDELENNFEQ